MEPNNEMPAPNFPCPECGKNFMLKKSMNRHLRNHGERQFECGLCHKAFARADLLPKHELTHSKPEKTESRPTGSTEKLCQICGKKFNRLDMLNRHLQTHTNNAVYSCQVCDKEFNRKDSLLRHEKKHAIPSIPTPRGASIHKCGRCNAEFTRKDALLRHEKKHVREPQFHCTKCSKVFARKDTLFDHLKVCRPFASNSVSKPTVVTRQCKSQFHICEICHARFTFKTNLTRHQMVHDEKKFSCEACGKSWTRSKLGSHRCGNKEPNETPKTKTTPSDRVKKCRVKKMYACALPTDATEKAVVIEHMIRSPSKQTRTILEDKGLLQSVQAQHETVLSKAVLSDAKIAMSAIKSKRTTGAVRIRQKTAAIMIGETVKSAKKKTKAAKELFVRRIKAGEKTRQKIIEGNEAAFTDVNRNIRCLRIPTEWTKVMTEFWIEDGSRPTTDSTRSTVRKRIATKKYLEHTRHVCTRSYREVYDDFKSKHPEIIVCESSFRRCKPFFVKPATQRDLELCCCQCCVTVRKAFRGLMNYRQENKIEPVFSDVYQMVKSTLCPKPEGQAYHNLKCLKQQCEKCGLKLLNFCDAEKTDDTLVTWFRYEKVDFTTKKVLLSEI